MAEKNSYEAALAEAVHEAERRYGEALADTGSNRIENINRACEAMDRALRAYNDYIAGVAYDR